MDVLLGLDIGTTHCKAGLFFPEGSLQGVASRPTLTHRTLEGNAYFDPEQLWASITDVIHEVMQSSGSHHLVAIGIASMAETGLLIDADTGKPRTPFIPWFDPAPTPQAEVLKREGEPFERFCRSGIRPNFKCSLAKLLWLRDRDETLLIRAIWLSAADYIAYRLSGQLATDYSLAGRTYAFRIDQKIWDQPWLHHFDLDPALFPPPLPSGTPVGEVNSQDFEGIGLVKGTPVAIAGHDHVCAAFASGAVEPEVIFDSVGTAEALVGALGKAELGEREFNSGLAFGCHVAGEQFYWMGGLSASGGSVEWLRSILGEEPLSYDELISLLDSADEGPTGILYFPYLSGSGSPHTDLQVRGAFVRLGAFHGRAELAKAVLEGTAYEMEFIRQSAERAMGLAISKLVASGGGTRNRHWMQIKADISGCQLEVPEMPEATLVGAALLAGIGVGVFQSPRQALAVRTQPQTVVYRPDDQCHQVYQRLYQQGWLAMQAPLRHLGSSNNNV